MKKIIAASVAALFLATGAVAAVPGAAKAVADLCCC